MFIISHFCFSSNLTTCFSHIDGAWLCTIVKRVSKLYVKLSLQLDTSTPTLEDSFDGNGFIQRKYVSDASRNVLRTFNSILSDRQQNINPSKKDAIFCIANLLCLLYFRLKQIRLCQTIQANVISSGADISRATMAELVTFRYYLGRCHLYQRKIHQAKDHLLFSFLQCPDECYHQKRYVLFYSKIGFVYIY